jgi:hypothetical protein
LQNEADNEVKSLAVMDIRVSYGIRIENIGKFVFQGFLLERIGM